MAHLRFVCITTASPGGAKHWFWLTLKQSNCTHSYPRSPGFCLMYSKVVSLGVTTDKWSESRKRVILDPLPLANRSAYRSNVRAQVIFETIPIYPQRTIKRLFHDVTPLYSSKLSEIGQFLNCQFWGYLLFWCTLSLGGYVDDVNFPWIMHWQIPDHAYPVPNP